MKKLLVLLTFLMVAALGCNPTPGSGTVVRDGVGIKDYYTLRSVDGSLTTRDVLPEPKPREAITGDDYFQVKLESIYVGKALGRDVGNLAIISEIDGILPKEISCQELDVSELGFKLEERERATTNLSSKCAYKHVVAINPVFADGHATFNSKFITPPFRMGKRSVGLRFIIGQLNDVEMARMLVKWSEEQLNNLDDWGIEDFSLNQWQSKLVNIGFTVANYILDYAAKPDYIFDFQTDFVPIESVSGVTSPQNLLMGGDFVIVGFANNDEVTEKGGALGMSDELIFDSGNLYWKHDKSPFEDGPYIVFKVVRQSRYPRELPVSLSKVNRLVERGQNAEGIAKSVRNIVLDLQDANMLNETEGRFYLDVLEWYASARAIEADLKLVDEGGQLEDTATWPLQLRALNPTMGLELAVLDRVYKARNLLARLQERIYDKYERTPGITTAECTQLQHVTESLADYAKNLDGRVQNAAGDLATKRNKLQTKAKRTPDEEQKLENLVGAETWANTLMKGHEGDVSTPKCPGLRD